MNIGSHIQTSFLKQKKKLQKIWTWIIYGILINIFNYKKCSSWNLSFPLWLYITGQILPTWSTSHTTFSSSYSSCLHTFTGCHKHNGIGLTKAILPTTMSTPFNPKSLGSLYELNVWTNRSILIVAHINNLNNTTYCMW